MVKFGWADRDRKSQDLRVMLPWPWQPQFIATQEDLKWKSLDNYEELWSLLESKCLITTKCWVWWSVGPIYLLCHHVAGRFMQAIHSFNHHNNCNLFRSHDFTTIGTYLKPIMGWRGRNLPWNWLILLFSHFLSVCSSVFLWTKTPDIWI